MSGHSKWSNIRTKKEKIDNERAKIFTKLSKEISAAVRNFGSDVESNRKLRDLIAKAKANNVPNDNIERLIKKASGDVDKKCYEEIIYEGYGPSGVAILVETLTDNKNRTVANLRHYFEKFGGKLATNGCVSFMFSQKGFVCAKKANVSEEELMELCIEFEIDDFEHGDELVEFRFEPFKLLKVVDGLKNSGFEILLAEVRKIANDFVNLDDVAEIENFEKLAQTLDDDNDVQQIWTNLKEFF